MEFAEACSERWEIWGGRENVIVIGENAPGVDDCTEAFECLLHLLHEVIHAFDAGADDGGMLVACACDEVLAGLLTCEVRGTVPGTVESFAMFQNLFTHFLRPFSPGVHGVISMQSCE